MRILFISAFYPPHVAGGWEQLISDINARLQERGHETHVLTSQYGLSGPQSGEDVARVLHLESDLQAYSPNSLLTQKQRLRWNLDQTERIIHSFQPDVTFVQILWNLSRGVPWTAEQLLPGRVVYYMPSVWAYPPDTRANYWRDPAHEPLRRAVKRLVAPIALRSIKREHARFQLAFEHILCVSEASRTAVAAELGRDPDSMSVVNNGVELDLFHPAGDWGKRDGDRPLSLLFAGTVAHHKGVHTAVEAMSILGDDDSLGRPVKLTIVGSGNEAYEARLRDLAEGLGDRVQFYGRVPREQMPELMRHFDVLVLPSIWDEPLARVMQEAMATGLLVLGTNTGGTGEVLVDGDTGMVFRPGDPQALADCIRTVIANPVHAQKLACNGRQRILDHFSLDRMVDEIEAYLAKITDLDLGYFESTRRHA